MATLVQFLAAGVNGASQGTATFLFRGTATSAAASLWEDFEETTQPGTNVITLDQWGAAEVYCDVYCDVEIRNADGAFMHTYTIGNSAPLVEVRSTSFTGTDYDGSPANTVGEPATLKDVLDRWEASAGAPDWQVMFGGVATNFESALAGISGMFINVKDPQFGAVGDGVTDDTTAIMGALAAAETAGGGIVFFPPGTYQVSSLTPSTPEVTMMGCGPNSSNIRGAVAGSQVLRFTDNTSDASKRITGLKIMSSAAYQALVHVEENQRLAIDNCEFDETNTSIAAVRRVASDGGSYITIDSCKFIVAAATSAIQNLSDDGESFISVRACLFEVNASFTGAIIDGPDFSVAQCKFDAHLVTAGTYYHVNSESNEAAGRYIGVFIGNTFIDGASSGFGFKLSSATASSEFFESNNTFRGFASPALTSPGNFYEFSAAAGYNITAQVIMASRVGGQVTFTNTSASMTISTVSAQLVADVVGINQTSALGTLTIAPSQVLPLGSEFTLLIANSTGGNMSVEFRSTSTDKATAGPIGNGDMALAKYKSVIKPSTGALVYAIVSSRIVSP